MKILVKKYIEPLNIKNFIFVNIIILIVIKVAVPFYGTQLATVLQRIIPFDSREIISETNKARVTQGLSALIPNAELDFAAERKLNDMISNGYFAHISPQGVSPWFWITKTGYEYTYAGENLALGFINPKATVTAWLDSSSHRKNLLNKNYTEIGVATGNANLVGIDGILVVQMFGRPSIQIAATQPVPSPKTSPVQTATPRQSPKVSSVPIVSNVVSGLETIQTKPVRNQISTDDKIPAVEQPVQVISKDQPGLSSVAGELNFIYEIYMALAIIMLGITIVFLGVKRNLVLATTVSFALFMIAIYTPVLAAVGQNLIF